MPLPARCDIVPHFACGQARPGLAATGNEQRGRGFAAFFVPPYGLGFWGRLEQASRGIHRRAQREKLAKQVVALRRFGPFSLAGFLYEDMNSS